MRLSVQSIMEAIGASVNQDPTMPTAGGSEWDLWLNFINRSVAEWAQSGDWEDLRKTHYPTISGLTQATISLPQDFRKLASFPKHWGTGVDGGEDWPSVLPEELSLYNDEDDYVYVGGDLSGGYNLVWNPGTLSSGASISIPYYSIPTSLASPAQIPVVPDSQFLVDRVMAYILEARSDARFQEVEAKAREKLMNMREQGDAAKFSSYAGRNYVKNTSRLSGFRVGRD